MRVITGTARGRRLETLDGLEVRPTTDKVKEAVFSAIQFEVEGAMVLDLFCGSGQMGIEALSRGAGKCVFVDNLRASTDITKKNLVTTDLFNKSKVVSMDVEMFLSTTKDKYDIIFMDPPYSKGLIQKCLPKAAECISDGGVILCEHEFNDEVPEQIGEFNMVKQYKYGRVFVTTYRKQ